MAKSIKFIAAIDGERGLAKNGRLPWDLPSDRKFFRDHIKSGVGLMGWNTFEDNGRRPFPTSPRNVVITHRREEYDGVEIIHNLQKFIDETDDDIWVIGGGDVFSQLLGQATHLYLTRVSGEYGCDVFFPEFEDAFTLVKSGPVQQENHTDYCYQLWRPNAQAAKGA